MFFEGIFQGLIVGEVCLAVIMSLVLRFALPWYIKYGFVKAAYSFGREMRWDNARCYEESS